MYNFNTFIPILIENKHRRYPTNKKSEKFNLVFMLPLIDKLKQTIKDGIKNCSLLLLIFLSLECSVSCELNFFVLSFCSTFTFLIVSFILFFNACDFYPLFAKGLHIKMSLSDCIIY